MNKFVLLLLLLLLTPIVGCSADKEAPYNYGTLDLEKQYNQLDQMVNDSTIIAEVKLLEDSKTINYKDNDFSETKVDITNVYKGDASLKDSDISLLELSMLSLVKDKGNGKFVLFLKPYEGPVTSNAYVITGVYQGKFNVDSDGQLVYDADKYGGIKTFQSDFVKTPLKKLSDVLK